MNKLLKERAYEECGENVMLSPLPSAFISTVMEHPLCEITSVLKRSLFRKQRKKTKIIQNLVMDNNKKKLGHKSTGKSVDHKGEEGGLHTEV